MYAVFANGTIAHCVVISDCAVSLDTPGSSTTMMDSISYHADYSTAKAFLTQHELQNQLQYSIYSQEKSFATEKVVGHGE